MAGRRTIVALSVALGSVALLGGDGLAGPRLAPAPYVSLPVGTVLDYGWWRCKVESSDGFETTCADRQFRVRIYGKFVVHGEQNDGGYGGAVARAPLRGFQGTDHYLLVPRTWMDADARRAIRDFWPLRVGKRARLILKHGRAKDDRIEVTLEATGTERLRVAGRQRDVYVVRATNDYYANMTTADISGSSAADFPSMQDRPPYRNEQTWWYDPTDGIVVKSRLAWKDFPMPGYGHAYELVKTTTPQPPPVARAPRRAGETPAVPGNRHGIAVIIGNRSYTGGTPAVEFAHNDAAAMKRFVVERLGYRPGNVIDLRDATSADLRATFGDDRTHQGLLFNWVRAGRSDVVVYYSGHGAPGLRDRRSYLLPSDGRPNLAELTGYPLDTLLRNLAKIPARSMTVIVDACFSGNTAKGMLVHSISGIRVGPRRRTAHGITLLTAARSDQVASWDEQAGHGLFTSYLLRALHGAADGARFGNGDGKVTVAEVRTYLDETMTYQARRRYNRAQNATIDGPADQVLAIYSRDAGARAGTPPGVSGTPR